MSKEKTLYQEDIFDIETKNENTIRNQIEIRKEKLNKLNEEIDILSNYNYKVAKRADFEQVYNKDNSSIKRYMEENNKIINQHKFLYSKIQGEIRVLSRMLQNKEN